jgi:hypothetical protein
MGKLALSVAIGDYDRTRPLIDGRRGDRRHHLAARALGA